MRGFFMRYVKIMLLSRTNCNKKESGPSYS